MNSKGKFAIVIVLMLVVVAVIEYRMPQRFHWEPTFGHEDGQPFGCMVFDSIMSQTMPRGYTVVKKTLWQMEHDCMLTTPHGIVIMTSEDMGMSDVKNILRLTEEGHIVLLVADRVGFLEDTLGIIVKWNRDFSIKAITTNHPEKQPVRWVGENGYQKADTVCRVYDSMITRIMELNDSMPFETLADYKHEEWVEDTISEDSVFGGGDYVMKDLPIAFSLKRSKGELIVLSAPLLMTNYAILNHDNGAVFIHRLMDRMKHLPVIRTESYMSATARDEQSPFYVFLHHPPLRWALYLVVSGIILFCIFTARRRQRPIPVIQQPQNGNLEFVRLIGTLYWQEGNHQGLLKKKLTYAADEIRRQTGLDIMESDSESDTMAQLARLAGADVQELTFVIRNIKKAVLPENVISEADMKAFTAELDKLLDSL